MTNHFRRLLSRTRGLESRLTEAVENAARTAVGAGFPAPPLEIVALAADAVAAHVQPAGRGRYAFPFNTVALTFVAPCDEDRVAFDAVCAGPPTIEDRVRRRLVSAGCDAAALDLDVNVVFAATADGGWKRPEFHVSLARVESGSRPPRPVETPPIRVDLLISTGEADRGAYTFTSLPIAIGRGAEVRDNRQQLLRVNHVAFADDGSDVNGSVSRRHARIELDAGTRRPRLIDDNSAQGTSVIRGGRGVGVPRGSRGLALQTGDEIVLGRARIRVRLGPA